MFVRQVSIVAIFTVSAAIGMSACKGRGKQPEAQPPPSTETTPAPSPGSGATTAAQMATPLLFRVEKEGKASHLLGTIDAGFDVKSQLPPAVWAVVDGARAMVLEWNLLEITMPMLRRSDGKKLSGDLSPEELKALTSAVGANWVSQLEDAKPSFVAAVLSARGLSTRNPMQAVLAARAEEKQLAVVFLESGTAQQERMDRWLDLRAVRALLADPNLEAENKKLVDAFVAGDVVALAAMKAQRMPWKRAGRSGTELDELDRATITDRHTAWLPTLVAQLGEGRALIAVDAMHLVGEKSLLSVLQNAGFTVQRL